MSHRSTLSLSLHLLNTFTLSHAILLALISLSLSFAIVVHTLVDCMYVCWLNALHESSFKCKLSSFLPFNRLFQSTASSTNRWITLKYFHCTTVLSSRVLVRLSCNLLSLAHCKSFHCTLDDPRKRMLHPLLFTFYSSNSFSSLSLSLSLLHSRTCLLIWREKIRSTARPVTLSLSTSELLLLLLFSLSSLLLLLLLSLLSLLLCRVTYKSPVM